MRINEEGRLVVNFKTEARFRGQFVMSHSGKIGARALTYISRTYHSIQRPPIGLPCGPYPLFIYFWSLHIRGPSCVKVPGVISANVRMTPQRFAARKRVTRTM